MLSQLQPVFPAGINDGGTVELMNTGLSRIITTMNMTVDQVSGFPAVQQRQKCFKTTVDKILFISVSGNRSMRQNKVNASGTANLTIKMPDTP